MKQEHKAIAEIIRKYLIEQHPFTNVIDISNDMIIDLKNALCKTEEEKREFLRFCGVE